LLKKVEVHQFYLLTYFYYHFFTFKIQLQITVYVIGRWRQKSNRFN